VVFWGCQNRFVIAPHRLPAMSIFRRPDYRSDTTEFIDQLKVQRPELEAEQRQGRGLLWDKPIDRDIQAEFKQGRVAQNPYVYQTKA
jgi:hypothetical protein